MEKQQVKAKNIKLDFKDSKYATGKRKKSIAKIWLKKGTGKIYVNGKMYDEYFKREQHKMKILRPFEIISQNTEYDVRCNVSGGGLSGQTGAISHGISKALLMFDSNLKTTLKFPDDNSETLPKDIWFGAASANTKKQHKNIKTPLLSFFIMSLNERFNFSDIAFYSYLSFIIYVG